MDIYNPNVASYILGANGEVLRCKTIEIGSWNMDTIASKNVTHGLTDTNIRGVWCTILDDSGGGPLPLLVADIATGGNFEGWVNNYSGVAVNLTRRTGGLFDSASYNDPGVNRGYLYLWYVD